MSPNDAPPIRIRIIRKGNGLVQVLPYPAILASGETFRIVNASGEDAQIIFSSELIQPVKSNISARRFETYKAGAGPAYVEFDVVLGSGHCAEGGSRPGAIIDP
jgi:hypothetical protein